MLQWSEDHIRHHQAIHILYQESYISHDSMTTATISLCLYYVLSQGDL